MAACTTGTSTPNKSHLGVRNVCSFRPCWQAFSMTFPQDG
jgi:hypothetical protein